MRDSRFRQLAILIGLALLIRLGFVPYLAQKYDLVVFLAISATFFGGVYLIRQTAAIIEQTTGVLKGRTGLAGGLLQSLGTAFPDMVIGVISAILSLQVVATNPLLAINLAIIAASTTFGSNIYNVFHAAWCVWRQNRADQRGKELLMFPHLSAGGQLLPIEKHQFKPALPDLEAAHLILVLLSFLTTAVALGMVLFGKVARPPSGISGDLYQLTGSVGWLILFLSLSILFLFRKSHQTDKENEADNPYYHFSTLRLWLELLIAGVIILLAAESLVHTVARISEITGVPYVLMGVATALVGCLGEIMVVHNFSVHPKGRIADAIIGVAMDNIVTTMGAAIIAIMGGIFLGSNALIIIFVLILFGNTVLIRQIAQLSLRVGLSRGKF